MRGHLEPLSVDPAAGRRLGLHAVTARAQENRESAEWVRSYERRFAADEVNGRLYVVGGLPTGFVSWFSGGPAGVSVELLYLRQGASDPEQYGGLLSAVEEEVGPVAFVPGPLAGLSPEVEDRLMRSLGYRRYSRSEMVFQGGGSIEPVDGDDRIRPVERSDLDPLAELHRQAYQGSFDRYLFAELADEREDAQREVREIVDGRWGEFFPEGSWLGERNGRLVGAILTVHGFAGALIVDVMVAPEEQGQGMGRRLLATALRSIRRAGEPRIYLNVTEGNERALRLYRGAGFVRSLGPTRDWYNARRIPIPPVPDA